MDFCDDTAAHIEAGMYLFIAVAVAIPLVYVTYRLYCVGKGQAIDAASSVSDVELDRQGMEHASSTPEIMMGTVTARPMDLRRNITLPPLTGRDGVGGRFAQSGGCLQHE